MMITKGTCEFVTHVRPSATAHVRELISGGVDPLRDLESALARVEVQHAAEQLAHLLQKAVAPGVVLYRFVHTHQTVNDGTFRHCYYLVGHFVILSIDTYLLVGVDQAHILLVVHR